MNWGRIAAVALVLATAAAGVGVWYAQEYGFYRQIEAGSAEAAIALATASGPVTPTVADFAAIDATSSPLRWRACLTLADPLPSDATPYEGATPLIGPGWFDCFDAARLTDDLASGAARAYLSQPEIRPDVDRVLAIYPDGRAYGWHQYDDKTPERGVMD